MWGKCIFGDDELIYLKAYIESDKPKLEKKNRNYSVKAFERNKRRGSGFPLILIEIIAMQHLLEERFGLAGSRPISKQIASLLLSTSVVSSSNAKNLLCLSIVIIAVFILSAISSVRIFTVVFVNGMFVTNLLSMLFTEKCV